MKKTFLTSVFLLTALLTIGQTNSILSPPKVDRRIELLSIVSRLAGYEEYSQDRYKPYVKDIHAHFDKYINHPLIKFAKELRDSNGIGFDAVMLMAVHLKQPPALTPLITFSKNIPEERWGLAAAKKFASLLQKFYVDANCESFFKAEENTYRLAEEKFKPVYDKLDLNWYKHYYGKMPTGKFNIIIGLGNGGGNYGPNIIFPDGKEEIYAIIGTWDTDSLGQPHYTLEDDFPILLHEFNHSFVNCLIEKNKTAFEKSGSFIFNDSLIKAKMESQAYGTWEAMLSEALVRASVINYLKYHEPDGKSAEKELITELDNGFFWMKELVNLLSTYENSRQHYPTLDSFMPEIILFYNKTAKDISVLKGNYYKLCPHVLSIEQFKNNARDVDPALTELKITFDKPLIGKGWSILHGDKGKNFDPVTKAIEYTNNNTAIRLNVLLKPDTEYQFVLSGLAFKTPDGYPLDTYVVNFRTLK
jgi:hypothetical protein